MNRLSGIFIACMALFGISVMSLDAFAMPGNSSGAGQSVEGSTSDKLSREKSLSQDKSNGTRSSSKSSWDNKSSSSAKHERSNKLELSSKLNGNPLFISEFISMFESGGGYPSGQADTVDAKTFFSRCRPITGIDAEFPVLLPGSTAQNLRISIKANPALANPNVRGAARLAAWDNTKISPSGQYLETGVIPYYVTCRRAANIVVGTVAETLSDLVNSGELTLTNEEDLRRTIRTGYENITQRQNWRQIYDLARSGVSHFCAPFLAYFWDVKDHDMDCGTFKIQGDTIYIDGMPTLSAEAINGRRFEIALSVSDSRSLATSNERSRSAGGSSETFSENKKTAGMKAAKASEKSMGGKTTRDSKADVSAVPQH